MSDWTKYVTKFYKEQKKKNADYKFKDALKAAAKTYKKQGKVDKVNVKRKNTKKRTIKNKTRKQKK